MTAERSVTERNIIVATTDRDLGVLLRVALERKGFSVRVVDSGKDLVSRALACVPEMVVLERDLPDLSGEEALKNLHAFDSTCDTPTIVIINDSSEIESLAAFRRETDRILQKPFPLEKLDRAVAATLEHEERAATA